MKQLRLEVFRGKDNQWFVRAVASNGQVVTVTEGYVSKANALRSARRMRISIATSRITVKE